MPGTTLKMMNQENGVLRRRERILPVVNENKRARAIFLLSPRDPRTCVSCHLLPGTVDNLSQITFPINMGVKCDHPYILSYIKFPIAFFSEKAEQRSQIKPFLIVECSHHDWRSWFLSSLLELKQNIGDCVINGHYRCKVFLLNFEHVILIMLYFYDI